MDTTVEIHGKNCQVSLSKAAKNALDQRDTPLITEMELTLACVVKKTVRFIEAAPDDNTIVVNDILHLRLTSGEHCGADQSETHKQNKIAPIVNWKAIAPHWVKLDFKKGGWIGEFGYGRL